MNQVVAFKREQQVRQVRSRNRDGTGLPKGCYDRGVRDGLRSIAKAQGTGGTDSALHFEGVFNREWHSIERACRFASAMPCVRLCSFRQCAIAQHFDYGVQAWVDGIDLGEMQRNQLMRCDLTTP